MSKVYKAVVSWHVTVTDTESGHVDTRVISAVTPEEAIDAMKNLMGVEEDAVPKSEKAPHQGRRLK